MKLRLLLLCFLSMTLQASIKVGKLAPDFSLRDENNKMFTLSSLRGKKIALVFYPKNDSYYCTKEVCSLREGSTLLAKNNIIILGINYAEPEDNKKFKEKYNVPFSFLSDCKKKVSKIFGTDSWWTLGFFPKRKTFLIDEQGIIVAILDAVDVEKHAQQIIDNF